MVSDVGSTITSEGEVLKQKEQLVPKDGPQTIITNELF